MKRSLFILICSLVPLFSLSVKAQPLENLPDDPGVTRGRLANGMQYYMVADASHKGRAEFSILQRTCHDGRGELARHLLADSTLLHGRSVEGFLLDRGVKYGRKGFVEQSKDAVLIRFRDVETARPESSLDTLLYLMTGMAGKAIQSDPVNYGTDNQILIMTGDIDKAALLSKLKIFSLGVPKHESTGEKAAPYEWYTRPALCFMENSAHKNLAYLEIHYFGIRIAPESMGTLVPSVSEQLAGTLSAVTARRVETVLRNRRIPAAGIDVTYSGSASSTGDETFTISMTVPSDSLRSTVAAVSSAVGAIGRDGITDAEAAYGYYKSINEKKSALKSFTPSSLWTDRCVAAELYGCDLSSQANKLALLNVRPFNASAQAVMVNRFATGLLSQDRNFDILCKTCDDISPDEILDIYRSSWTPQSLLEASSDASRAAAVKSISKIYDIALNDTTRYPDPSPKKLSPKKTLPEASVGGTMWQFPNGIRVVHKQAPTDGQTYFSFISPTGFSSVKDMKQGEGAYFSEYFKICKIGDVKGRDIFDILQACGITLSCSAEFSGFSLDGVLPSSKLPLLMRSLLEISSGRKSDKASFEYYLACQKIEAELAKGSYATRMAEIETLLSPGFPYTSCKTPKALSEKGYNKSNAYFQARLSKLNDGVLMLISDRSDDEVLKVLSQYVGLMNTDMSAAPRNPISLKLATGTSQLVKDGTENAVDVVIAADFQLSSESRAALLVAQSVLRDRLNAALAGTGMYADVDLSISVLPRERAIFAISAREAQLEGLPAGTARMSPSEIRTLIVDLVADLAQTPVDAVLLKTCKSTVRNELLSASVFPSYWMSLASHRFSDGKDFGTKAPEKVDAVNAEKLKSVFAILSASGRVEYITSAK